MVDRVVQSSTMKCSEETVLFEAACVESSVRSSSRTMSCEICGSKQCMSCIETVCMSKV
jgi:hypothetical protein